MAEHANSSLVFFQSSLWCNYSGFTGMPSLLVLTLTRGEILQFSVLWLLLRILN